MAINKNHEFEELDGIKCGIVEKNVPEARARFLKRLLEFNGFTVVIAASPLPKAAPVAAAKPTDPGETMPAEPAAPPPQPVVTTCTVGVTDVTFNPINAIFGRLLHTPDGHVVTQAYWQQKESVSQDDIPYFARENN